MSVPVVGIRKVRVRVRHRLVSVHMSMPHAGSDWLVVVVLVVLVMHVPVVVSDRVVGVLVFVPFCEVQPHPDRHEHARQNQRHGNGCAER